MAERRRDRGDGALFKRSDGRWVARVTVDGQRFEASATTKAEAAAKLRKLRAEADAGRAIAPGNITVARLLEEWATKALPNRRGGRLEASTLGVHRAAIRALTGPTARLASRRIRDLTADHVDAALERLAAEGKGRSKRTIASYRATLAAALDWARRRRWITINVARDAELPVTARPAETGRTMTADEARAFLAAAEGTPLAAMWTAMLHLGLRPGEAAGLSWQDVDLAEGVVHVARGRKRDARGAAVVGKLKTGWSARTLTAPPVVVEALRAHRQAQKRQRLAAGPLWSNADDLVFTSATGQPTDPAATRREFRRVLARAGLEGFTPNHLRHSAASLMADAGVPIEEVADQLGHRDTRMVSRHYRHRIKPAVDGGTVLGQILGSGGGDG